MHSSGVLEVIANPTAQNIDELVAELGATALLRDAHGGDWKDRPYLQWSWGSPEALTCQILVGPHRGVTHKTLVISEADVEGIIAQAQARQPKYAGQTVKVQRVSDSTMTERVRLPSYQAV